MTSLEIKTKRLLKIDKLSDIDFDNEDLYDEQIILEKEIKEILFSDYIKQLKENK